MPYTSLPRIESAIAHDGYRFFVRVWDAARTGNAENQDAPRDLKASSPLARVFFLHGIISHGGWYENTCARIAAAGFEVHFLDRRGAGLNAEARGDVDSFHTWMRDVADYIAARSADSRPAVLAGISWGGKLVLAVAKQHPRLLAGAALICPGMFSRFGSTWFERGAVGIASRTPARGLQVRIPLQDPRLFTDDPAWQRFIERDPLVLRRLTLRGARANLELSSYLADVEASSPDRLLLILAGRDRIIDNDATQRWFAATRASRKKLLQYPHAPHTPEFCGSPHHHVDDFIAWCERINDDTLENVQITDKQQLL